MTDALSAIERSLTELFQRRDPVAGDAALEARSREHVAGNARLSPAEQVDIYREQFWLRHRHSLVEDYPVLRHFLGDTAFDSFVRAYLDAHPPRERSLRDLGAHIVDFGTRYPFQEISSELALDSLRYELAFVDAFDGPDPAPLDAAVIASVPADAWSEAIIVLNPCVARLELHHPVHLVRYALKAKEPVPPAPRVEDGIRVALFRQNNVIRYDELSVEAFALLQALGEGVPLVPACERVTTGKTPAEISALEASVGGWFASWARAGFFARIDLPSGAT